MCSADGTWTIQVHQMLQVCGLAYLLLSDVLPHLSRLSRTFQKENVDLCHIQPCLKTTMVAIKQYLHNPGPNLSKVDHALATDLEVFQIVATYAQKEAFKSSV